MCLRQYVYVKSVNWHDGAEWNGYDGSHNGNAPFDASSGRSSCHTVMRPFHLSELTEENLLKPITRIFIDVVIVLKRSSSSSSSNLNNRRLVLSSIFVKCSDEVIDVSRLYFVYFSQILL